MPRSASRILALAVVSLLGGGLAPCAGRTPAPTPVAVPALTASLAASGPPVSYERDVAPVLNQRCVVCHACYDAPCQLVLTAFEGAERGATHQVVYDSSRLEAAPPTRLFVDARNTAEWRAKGFFPVLSPGADAPSSASLLLSMLALGHANPFQAGQRLPDSVGLDIDRPLSCPADAQEFDRYANEHPQGGMPYGTAPLSSEELRVLAAFATQGLAAPEPRALSLTARAKIAKWEAFLNGTSLKERITARYLYEHWFLAHLAFEELPSGPFFRVMRSRTRPGQPPDEIASVRPYDDPGTESFFYRIVPIDQTIVVKTHIVYTLGDRKLERLRELFLESEWTPTRLPGYGRKEASNPFIAFEDVPARSRYEYLLDDAHYFVMTFIRGPVCRGQVAVDVIEDHFWIAFLDPDHDPTVNDPTFLRKAKDLLSLPAENAGSFKPGDLWLEFTREQRKYMELRERWYDRIDPKHRGPALDWIWDGDGRNPNALLTVFRNFDNATVVQSFVGDTPKTAWVMDYPIFERIYYDLVAGFDIYGNLAHQVSTRLYMDHLRMQSEIIFLGFLPADLRKEMRASWYVGATREFDYAIVNKLRTLDHGTQIRFSSDDPKAELLEMIEAQAGAAAGPPDLLNRCGEPPCARAGADPVERGVEGELERIASRRGEWVRLLPEVSFVRVTTGVARSDLLYTLVHNVSHRNVAFMFDEEERLVPEDDTVSVVRGHFGAYPNFFFEVRASDLGAFVDELAAMRAEADLTALVDRYGIRRTSPRFWQTADWLNADFARSDPVQAGIYDLNRYDNL
jgi:hypothetical protein